MSLSSGFIDTASFALSQNTIRKVALDGTVVHLPASTKYIGVYGDPNSFNLFVSIPKQEWKENHTLKTHEPRYLGFNVNGDPVSNDNFPNDFIVDGNPLNRNYLFLNSNLDSWDLQDYSEFQYARLFTDDLYNDDGDNKASPYTSKDIMESNGLQTSKFKGYTELQVLPTNVSKGTLVWSHAINGKTLYDTMEILPNKQTIFPETNLAVSDNTIVVGYDEDVTSYDITATVESNFDTKNNRFNGTTFKNQYFIKEFQQIFNGIESQSNGKVYFTTENVDIPESDRKYTYNLSIPVPREGQSATYEFSALTSTKLHEGTVDNAKSNTVTVTIEKQG